MRRNCGTMRVVWLAPCFVHGAAFFMLTVRYKTEIIYESDILIWESKKDFRLRQKFDADLSEVRDSESIENAVSYLAKKAPSPSF